MVHLKSLLMFSAPDAVTIIMNSLLERLTISPRSESLAASNCSCICGSTRKKNMQKSNCSMCGEINWENLTEKTLQSGLIRKGSRFRLAGQDWFICSAPSMIKVICTLIIIYQPLALLLTASPLSMHHLEDCSS